MPKLVRVFLDNTLESGLDLLATWLTSETLLKVKLFSLRIMVYMEAQTVKVLRANQKNAKCLQPRAPMCTLGLSWEIKSQACQHCSYIYPDGLHTTTSHRYHATCSDCFANLLVQIAVLHMSLRVLLHQCYLAVLMVGVQMLLWP